MGGSLKRVESVIITTMRFVFFVQGEGRGHMSQAITLSKILNNAGHRVSRVLVGKSPAREIPAFFRDKINAPVETYESPNFARDNKNKGVRIIPSILGNLKRTKEFLAVTKRMKEVLQTEKPDMVINFYELLAGITYKLYKPRIPMFCIGHQYLFLHPEFVFPKGRFIDKFLIKLNTKITSSGAKILLALSFYEMADIPGKRLFVVPPLLRQEVLSLEEQDGNYFHGYILNSGYADEIKAWHEKNPGTRLHFFWDNKEATKKHEKVSPGLTFHKINDLEFLQYMRSCKGFATTAGFESICEAIYLNKPVLMVPTSGHFEQECNALDALRCGVGIVSRNFNLSKLAQFIPNYRFDNSEYRKRVLESAEIFLRHLTSPLIDKKQEKSDPSRSRGRTAKRGRRKEQIFHAI